MYVKLQLRESEKRLDQLDKFNSESIVSVIVRQPTDDMLYQCCSGTQWSVCTTQPIHILKSNNNRLTLTAKLNWLSKPDIGVVS